MLYTVEEIKEQYTLYIGCPCDQGECESVEKAELLLFPFLVEFCLVIACMWFEVWCHVDHKEKEEDHGKKIRTSYGLYGSYRGSNML